jgi:hypothetical protein
MERGKDQWLSRRREKEIEVRERRGRRGGKRRQFLIEKREGNKGKRKKRKRGGKKRLWRACNLTSFIHSSTGPVVHPFASRQEGPGFNPQGGTYVKPGFSC